MVALVPLVPVEIEWSQGIWYSAADSGAWVRAEPDYSAEEMRNLLRFLYEEHGLLLVEEGQGAEEYMEDGTVLIYLEEGSD